MILLFTYGLNTSRDSDGNGLRAIGDSIMKSQRGLFVFYQQWTDYLPKTTVLKEKMIA